MADVFISYTKEDRETAANIAQSLASQGWSTWWDRSIPPGADFYDVIEFELESAHCVVVLWSVASIGSRWVRAEATEALTQGKYLPVLLDASRPPLVFRQVQTITLQPQRAPLEDPGLRYPNELSGGTT